MGIKISKATVCSLCGMVGVGVTALLAYKAGKKAQANPAPENETKKEKAARVAKTYGPTVVTGVTTCVLILAGDRIHVKKEMALGAAAVMWKEGYFNLDKAVKEVVGEEKAEEINKHTKPEPKPTVTTDTKGCEGLSNCIRVYEPYTDQYIWTTRELIAWTMLEANRRLQKDLVCTINVIATGLGGKPTEEGNKWRWDFESETLDYNWGFFNMGPWIDIQTRPCKHGPEMVLELYYTVEPIEPSWEDKLYRESN